MFTTRLTNRAVIDAISGASQKSDIYRFFRIGSIERGYANAIVWIQFGIMENPYDGVATNGVYKYFQRSRTSGKPQFLIQAETSVTFFVI